MRFRTALWLAARILPWRVRRRPLDAVLSLAEPADTGRYAGLSVAYVARAVRRTTRHPWVMRDRPCLRSGLLGYRFLREAGFHPQLRFGVDPRTITRSHAAAHCWVCVDDTPVINDRLPGMTDIFVHPDNAAERKRA